MITFLDRLIRHTLLSPVEAILIFTVIAAGIGMGYYVHNTLTEVRQALPAEILHQAGEINFLLRELDVLVDAVKQAEADPEPERRQAVLLHNQALQDHLAGIRAGYVLDNLLGAAAVHALVHPASQDIQRWLTEGLPGLDVDSPLLMQLVETRARDVHDRALDLSRQANVIALELLARETRRLDRFQGAMLALLAALLVLTLIVLHLLLRKRRVELRLAVLRDQLSAAIESIPEGFVLCDANDRIVLCNEPYRRIYSNVRELIVPGRPFVELASAFFKSRLVLNTEGRLEEAIRERMARHRNPGSPFDYELRDGRRIRVSERRTRDGGVVGIHADMTDVRQVQERLRHLAGHDPLTGLANRHLCQERLEQTLAQARRHASGFALLYLDLDRFKQVNDTLGHQAGDVLLRAVARRLNSCLRAGDTLARLGGDEFLAIVEDLAEPDSATACAQRLIEVLAEPFRIDTDSVTITTSIGIACFPEHGEDADTLIRHADLASYHAKAQGVNRWCVYWPELDAEQPLSVSLQA